jgi:hypothetical protein
VRRAENVHAIDRIGFANGDRPNDIAIARDARVLLLARGGIEPLGIVEPASLEAGRQNDSRRDDRTRQRTAASLIDAGHGKYALFAQTQLVPKRAGHPERPGED